MAADVTLHCSTNHYSFASGTMFDAWFDRQRPDQAAGELMIVETAVAESLEWEL